MADALRLCVTEARKTTPGADLLGAETKARLDEVLRRAKERRDGR